MANSPLVQLHKELWATFKMPADFVLHSLIRTSGRRLSEGGADAFPIMRLKGHSSVIISRRYVHPTTGTLQGAVDKVGGLGPEGSEAGSTVKTTGTRYIFRYTRHPGSVALSFSPLALHGCRKTGDKPAQSSLLTAAQGIEEQLDAV